MVDARKPASTALSLRSRIFLGFGLLLAILAGSAALNWSSKQVIARQFGRFQMALAERLAAVDMDLQTQTLRVRVNQWLRSMNPQFAKQADELLDQYAGLMSKADTVAQSDRAHSFVATLAQAVAAYTVSWHAIRAFYADEAKAYADGIQAPAAGMLATMSRLRDAAPASAAPCGHLGPEPDAAGPSRYCGYTRWRNRGRHGGARSPDRP